MSQATDDQLAWDKSEGLIPAIVQHCETRELLMLAYMNRESLAKTRETGLVTFYSRSRRSLWTKGETSGNTLACVEIRPDCDGDALLVLARPAGPTCHRGTPTCFDPEGYPFLGELTRVLESRFREMPVGSYTTKLITAGLDRMAQKVGEEGVETVIAAKNDDLAKFEGEAADLIFHLMVLLQAKGSSLARVEAVLKERHRR